MGFFDESIILALVALFVSLVALLVTALQLLTQVFATAEGTRQCSPSVLGPLGKLTRWRWRWSEARFETLYTTPELTLNSDLIISRGSAGPPRKWKQGVFLHCIEHGRCEGLIPSGPHFEGSTDDWDELARWTRFLGTLHLNCKGNEWLIETLRYRSGPLSSKSGASSSHNTLPFMKLREKSWDFMPPDVVRPLALTNVSDIAIMIRRMGMTWDRFKPSTGNFSAEGGSHVISSMVLRGFGTVMQYRMLDLDGKPVFDGLDGQRINIWTKEVDKLMFGILSCIPCLRVPEFRIGTLADRLQALEDFNDGNTSMRRAVEEEDNPSIKEHMLSCLYLLASPVFRCRASGERKIPLQIAHHMSLFDSPAATRVFFHRLEGLVDGRGPPHKPAQLKWILDQEDILRRFNDHVNPSDKDLDILHDVLDAADLYLGQDGGFFPNYDALLEAHLSKAPLACKVAQQRLVEGTARDRSVTGKGLQWLPEEMHLWFDWIPDYVRYLENSFNLYFSEDIVVAEAWATMMFRGMCWRKLHIIDELRGDFLPSQYYNSKLPIYIG